MPELESRYSDPIINRQYWLGDALIRVRSYEWRLIDKVASELSDSDVAAFHRVVAALNKESQA